MSNAWTVEVDGDWIAWFTFDLPDEKVNKFTSQAMADLGAMLQDLHLCEACIFRRPKTFTNRAFWGYQVQISITG